jgi:tRNA (guanine-N7-)-methyltransferase
VGRKNKLKKFAEVLAFPNVFECYNVQTATLVSGDNMVPVDMKGRWHSNFFKNENPLSVELACGGGEYTVELARRYPDRNFIGVDIKGNRLWTGAKQALEEGLHNVAFLRTRIEIIAHFFAANEVDEIWITFPDPFPRSGNENRRLCAPAFLDRYRQILRPAGLVHLKHDDLFFYQYTYDVIQADPACALCYHSEDIYAVELAFPELDIKTLYESKHLAKNKTIKYLRFTINAPKV